jgi:predicted component of type VI protein secretion system
MYKSVNVNANTHKILQRLSIQLNKPKAQIVEILAKGYEEIMKEKEKAKLDKFNREMGAKVKALQFSKHIKVSTSNIDEAFSALAKTDYKG